MLASAYQTEFLEAGCDEAGRGCLAGPVFAAAVILLGDNSIPGLNDSKKLSEAKRLELRDEIEQKAFAYAIAFVDHTKIDEINILNASILAMHKALDGLKNKPGFIIVDGNKFKPYRSIPHETIVKGDGKYQSIAAASILAKSYRDEFMEGLHNRHPQYGWNQNKGYPTSKHREAIIEHGPSIFHRLSFNLTGNDRQISLFA